MFTTDPVAFGHALRDASPDWGRATMRRALLVDTTGFGISLESSADNAYMSQGGIDALTAAAEHAAVVAALEDVGVPCDVLPGIPGLQDGIWPNNVVATTAEVAVIGSMRHPVRRQEARRADLRALVSRGRTLVDLSDGPVVELTGVTVVDRLRGVAIIGASSRVDRAGAEAFHAAFGLRATLFTPLVAGEYHLNVVCASLAGRGWALHPGSFADVRVVDALASASPVVVLSDEEKRSWAGNGLAVTESVLMMSATARLGLQTRRSIENLGFSVRTVAISEIERGGGSLRCLIAELF
jgi:N-dimethylarginine dimethylaminohydrolase